jgi:hypothetical protein
MVKVQSTVPVNSFSDGSDNEWRILANDVVGGRRREVKSTLTLIDETVKRRFFISFIFTSPK